MLPHILPDLLWSGERTERYSSVIEVRFRDERRNSERLMLTRPIKEYHFVAQAETTIDGVDDKEEMLITDVSRLNLIFGFYSVNSLVHKALSQGLATEPFCLSEDVYSEDV